MVRTKSGRAANKAPAPPNEKFYEVESILSRRETNGQVEYLIKWKGYGEENNDWLQPGDLTPELQASAERQFTGQGREAAPVAVINNDAPNPPSGRRTRAKARQQQQQPVSVVEVDDSSETEIDEPDDWNSSKGKKKPATSKKKKKATKGKGQKVEKRGRPRKPVAVDDEMIVDGDNVALLEVYDCVVNVKVRKLTAKERDEHLFQLSNQDHVHLSDMSSEGSNIPTAVLEIEFADSGDELVPDLVPIDSLPTFESELMAVEAEATFSTKKAAKKAPRKSSRTTATPKKLVPEPEIPIDEEASNSYVPEPEPATISQDVEKKHKEYSLTKMQEIQPLHLPAKDKPTNRLAARPVVQRAGRNEISSNYLELKRQREEAAKISILKAKVEQDQDQDMQSVSQPSQEEPKAEKVIKEKKQDKKLDEDNDWGPAAAQPIVRPVSRIPKPVAHPPNRRDRRSIAIIPARAAPASLSKHDARLDQKRVLPNASSSKMTFKIPKRTTKGGEENKKNWDGDWKQATVSQNWSSAAPVAQSPAAASSTEEDHSKNQYNNAPLGQGNSYSALLPKIPIIRERNTFGYKPSWAIDEKTEDSSGKQSDDGNSGSGDTNVSSVPKTTDDSGWGDDEPNVNGAANPPAPVVKSSASGWGDDEEDNTVAAATPAPAIAARVEDDGCT